jgi:hypothetical protein
MGLAPARAGMWWQRWNGPALPGPAPIPALKLHEPLKQRA